MEWYGWVLTSLSIGGAILNSRLRVEGFYLWIVGNLGWGAVTIHKGMYSQTLLWGFYLGVCVYGIYKWRKEQGNGNSKTK